MKLSVIAICIALTVPAVWAQKHLKRTTNAGPGAPAHISLKFRSLKAQPLSLTPKQSSPAPAPGVVQLFLNPASGILDAAYFIATADIPAGYQISGSMTLLDDQSYMDFQPFTLQSDLQVGDSIQLPTFSNFGDVYFQAGASFDYTVLVTPTRGATTEADGTFLLGETLSNSDLTSFEPIINYATQSIAGNNDVILRIPGYYTGDPVLVVLSDLFANYVPPASAVTVSATEVDVDMSQLQGFDLTSLDGLLVSLSEDGFSDTVAFRYLPPTPGTFNLAPQ
jgi:hypothetical protein